MEMGGAGNALGRGCLATGRWPDTAGRRPAPRFPAAASVGSGAEAGVVLAAKMRKILKKVTANRSPPPIAVDSCAHPSGAPDTGRRR